MNTKDYTYLLNKPYSVTERQTMELESILSEFPYLQSARAIHLKGLYNQDSFRYNLKLKKTAAYTTDRSVLFDFITSEQFQGVERKSFEEKEKSLSSITVTGSEIVKPAPDKVEESIKLTIKKSGQPLEEPEIQTDTATATAREKLDIGKPIEFLKNEKHSFREWLQLSKVAPINREEQQETPKEDESKSKKLELIDKFIEANPKIIPVKNAPSPPAAPEKPQDTSSLMTETLAKVYLEQKKYNKAIQAYEILILKYPEKSVFFADRISDIKVLQQNNN